MLLTLAALAPSFVIVVLTNVEISRLRQAEVHDLALRGARQAASELERVLSGVETLLIAVAAVPDVRFLREEGCAAYLAQLRPSLPNLVGVAVLDLSGRRRCGSTTAATEINDADRAYFRDALNFSHMVVGTLVRGRVSGENVLPLASAIRDASGHAVGVVEASLDLRWLGTLLKQRGLPPGGSVTVADRAGTVLAREPYPEQFVGTTIPEEFMHLVNGVEPGVETVMSRDGTRRVLGYIPASSPPDGLYVSVGLSAEASYAAVSRASFLGAIAEVGAATAALVAMWSVGSRVFVRPVRHLSRVILRWQEGDHLARTGHTGEHGEIGLVGAQLDRLMDDVIASQEHRQLLADELAHRVKNTLATVQAIAAATINKPEPGTAVFPDFARRLAALSRTHNVLTRQQWDGADVDEVVRNVVLPLVGEINGRFRLDGPKVELPARETLAMTMVLHELCTNAIKYGALKTAAGGVDVTWTVTEHDERGRELTLVWKEKSAEPVSAPISNGRGFGMRMLARAFGGCGATTVDFEPTGIRCSVTVLLPAARV